LHTFNKLKLGVHGFRFFHGDNAVAGNFFHGIGNHVADFYITG